MNKVICDICGTQYPDTADQCPICGYAREIAGQAIPTERVDRNVPARASSSRSKGGRFSASNVRKRTDDAPAYQEKYPKQTKQPTREANHYNRAEPDSNPILVVLLVVVIILLLATTAFIFFRYFLPNVMSEEPTVPTEQTESVPESSEATMDDTIPCEALALTSGGSIEFAAEGEMSLLNVVLIPSDTTDELIYTSSDESIATVNEEGRVTAVGEGEAVITITCGKRQMQCNVICAFVTEQTEPLTTEEATENEETTETDAAAENEETE